MAWDDIANFLGQALGDVSLFLRKPSTLFQIPEDIARRQLEVQEPAVRQSLIGSPFRAGLLGVGGKDVGGQFQPSIPSSPTQYRLHSVTDENGKPIPGAYIDPTSGKFFKGGYDYGEVLAKAKEMFPNLDLGQFQVGGLTLPGGLKLERTPGPVPPPPQGMTETGARYDEKTNRWIPSAKAPGAEKPTAMSPDQLRALGIDPSSIPGGTQAGAPGPVQSEVEGGAAQIGVDPKFASAIAGVESGFRPSAISPKGARGVMQVMPTTSTTIQGQQATGVLPRPTGVSENIAEGEGMLAGLEQTYARLPSPIREKFVAAAYNAGQKRVDAARRQVMNQGRDPDDFGNVAPFLPRETQDYVGKVMQRWQGTGPSRIGAPAGGGMPMSQFLGSHPGSHMTIGPGGVRSVELAGPPQARTEEQKFFEQNPGATLQDWEAFKAASAGNLASARSEANQLIKEKYKTFPPQAQATLSSIYAVRGLAMEMKTILQDPTVASDRGALEGRIRNALFRWGIEQNPGENVYQTVQRELSVIGAKPYLAGGRGAISWINRLQAFLPSPQDPPQILNTKLDEILARSNELEKDVRMAAKERVNPELGAPGPTSGAEAGTGGTSSEAPATSGNPQQDFDNLMNQYR